MKRYDARYFERWYRRSRVGVGAGEFVGRKVRLAVSAAEYLLGREIANVLDVGCGEAPWREHLKSLRPAIAYTGLDSSEYAVRRYGRARNIRRASVSEVGTLGLRGPYDLVVCADVLHYLPSAEVRVGLAAMHAIAGAVAFIEAFTSADAVVGDRAAFQRRSPAVYRRLFAQAGWLPLGMHLYATREMSGTLVALERATPRARGRPRAPRG